MGINELKSIIKPAREMDKKKQRIYIGVLLICSILFLIINGTVKTDNSEKYTEKEKSYIIDNADEYVRLTEKRLEEALKKIDGAGQITVFINIEGGPEKVLATDVKASEDKRENSNETTSETEKNVVLSGQGSNQTPYIIKENNPKPVGVLVIAEGARDERVKNEIYESIKALFGLMPHRIKISY